MDWICPRCNKSLSGTTPRTWCVACGECGTVVTADMLKKLPRDFSGGSKKESPTVIFKGEWPGESIRGGKE